jgi:hypothetical protein
MIKSQFIILGILSLIAVVGSASTLSQVYAQVKASDILGLVDKASSAVSGSDVGGIADKSKPDFNALKSFADQVSSGASISDLPSSLSNPASTTTTPSTTTP